MAFGTPFNPSIHAWPGGPPIAAIYEMQRRQAAEEQVVQTQQARMHALNELDDDLILLL